jgi:GPH family glycoside/pentoside/hexuronide:cation symporter
VKSRLTLFAFGDFAFNLYWQSITLFLLFYYTDALELPMSMAAGIYSVASVWDGIANFVAGALSDRWRHRTGYRALLMAGSVPLGLACIATYMAPSGTGLWALLLLTAGHLMFRTLYAVVNVAYLVLGARLSDDSGERAFLAGARMLFGTLAWVAVAQGTVPVGRWVTASTVATDAYFGAALVFAAVSTLILLGVGAVARDEGVKGGEAPADLLAGLRSLAANRAFVTLNLAMMAMTVSIAVLNKAILYYFKYALDDEAAGLQALTWIGLVGLPAMPVWMRLRGWVGTRSLWFLAAGGAIATLVGLSLLGDGARAAQLYLAGLQILFVGLQFAFWAMLPNTIEYGEKTTGLRVEGTIFGVAALLQRIAIGLATLILGFVFERAGYVANAKQTHDMLEAIRLTMTVLPGLFIALSCLAMIRNPLGKGVHAQVLDDLKRG